MRILSRILIGLACVWFFVGVVFAVSGPNTRAGDDYMLVSAVNVLAGASGVVGGASALAGNRLWSYSGYAFASLLLYRLVRLSEAFVRMRGWEHITLQLAASILVGVIAAIVAAFWMIGLPRHLRSCEQIREARARL